MNNEKMKKMGSAEIDKDCGTKSARSRGIRKISYNNGAEYIGECKNSIPSGKGIMKYANGEVYEGEWQDGKCHGKGSYSYSDGSIYEGRWKEGKRHDRMGKLSFANGDKYMGEYKEDKLNGRGTFIFAGGNKYEGELKEAKRDGYGVFTWANGDVYDGEWKENKRHGKGRYKFANGDMFTGEYKEGKRDGFGMLIQKNGTKYIGEWKDGKYNGSEAYLCFDSEESDGDYNGGERHRKGKQIYSDGKVYEGECQQGLRHIESHDIGSVVDEKVTVDTQSVSLHKIPDDSFVFISYSSREIEMANQVKHVLETNGVSCWMAPQSIPAGNDYGMEIPKAIEKCKAFLLLLSDASQKSNWVPKEVGLAIGKGKIVVPFQIDNATISDAFNFYLTNSQRISAYNRMAEAYQELLDRLKDILS